MKVAFFFGRISETYDYIFSILNTLDIFVDETKHEFFIFLEYAKDAQKIGIQSSKVHVINVNSSLFTQKYHSKDKLNRLIKRYRIQFLYIMTEYIKYNVSIPYAFTVWDLEHRFAPFFPEVNTSHNGRQWYRRELQYADRLPRASYLVTGTEQGKKEIVSFYGVPPERIKVIPFPSPAWDIKRESNIMVREKIPEDFLFLPSRFHPHKNHIVVILAVKVLKEKYGIPITVVFSGFGRNREYIERKVQEEGLANQIFFLGFVSRDDIVCLYAHALALIFPSFFGPDNLPPVEAFYMGCPVIASDIPGSEEQIGDAGLRFNPKDEYELAEKIYQLLNNPNLRETLIKRGSERVRNLTPQRYMKEIIAVLDEFEPIRRTWE